MGKINRIKYIIAAILALFVFALTNIMLGGVGNKAYAATTSNSYSSVIDDLAKDRNFNFADYPEIKYDYSIRVIQISESVNGELFVYTYQPSQNTKSLVATELNMSLSKEVDGTKLYRLSLIDTWGVFAKYLVKDITVSKAQIRYYNISSIYRKWIYGIDAETGNDNTINGKAFSVGKLFSAMTFNNEVYYHCTELEVIEIINPYHDFIRYSNGFKFLPDSCDGHYIAFSTNKQIDRLIEAEVYYKAQPVLMNNPMGEPEEKQVKLTEIAEASNEADGWFAVKHTWNRIESAEEFFANEELSPETKQNLKDKQWFLRFCETTYSLFKGVNGLGHFESYTEVSEVTILRLTFESDGVIYNLGAVSDKITGDNVPGNPIEKDNSFWDKFLALFDDLWDKICNFFKDTFGGLSWWQWVLIIVALVVGLPLILSIFFVGVRKLVLVVFKSLWWLICLPFRALKKLFGGGE